MSWSLKNEYSAPADGRNLILIFSSLRVCFLEKYDELSESVAFCQKFRYFTDQTEWTKGGPHENDFEYFQIQKWMLQTERKK